jgi:hypothetical protein
MSQTLNDITNTLISLYATLDSWCDMGQKTFVKHSDGRVHQTLHNFILESRLTLSTVDCGGKISAHSKIEYAAMLHDLSIDELRNELRQLLFEYLCLLEKLGRSVDAQKNECVTKISNLISASQKKVSVMEVHV